MKGLFFCTMSLFSLAVFFLQPIYAQMPDWFFFRDGNGNGYYYDRAFHIRITDKKAFSYDPVTVNGIDYYYNLGINLVQEGKLSEGLFYLKSIRLLKSSNSRIVKTRADSTKWLNLLYKKHGVRFEESDLESTVLLAENDGLYELVNEKLFYRMSFSSRPYIIKSAWRERNRSYGLKIGINTAGPGNTEGFDYLVGVETRIYSNAISSIEETENIFRFETGNDASVKSILFKKDDRIVYSFEYNDAPFCGIEAFYNNGRMIHMARGICHKNLKDMVFEEIKKNIDGLVLVKQD